MWLMASLEEEIKSQSPWSPKQHWVQLRSDAMFFWLVGPEGQRQLKEPPLEQMRCREAFQFPVWVFSSNDGCRHHWANGRTSIIRQGIPQQPKRTVAIGAKETKGPLSFCGSDSSGLAVKVSNSNSSEGQRADSDGGSLLDICSCFPG